ncbi:MAG: type II toxin-antitoxin system VapC family toxin [Deltaproteobacteria bacterium]|nr:type II toxin-antitoxin system VapC family toxin [Deltaproteobacteria bacterium]
MRYWDSSALVPLIVREPASLTLERLLRQNSFIVSCWMTSLECWSALVRKKRDEVLTEEKLERAKERLDGFTQAMDIVPPTQRLKQVAMRLLSVHTLRAGDAVQLASALMWCHDHPKDAEFVTLDARLRSAALAEGFRVVPSL